MGLRACTAELIVSATSGSHPQHHPTWPMACVWSPPSFPPDWVNFEKIELSIYTLRRETNKQKKTSNFPAGRFLGLQQPGGVWVFLLWLTEKNKLE